jgi:hypothetical protein
MSISAARRRAGAGSDRRRGQGRRQHDDRPRRHLRRRRHGAGRAQRHGRRRSRQEGGANIDAWLRGTTYVAAAKHELATFEKLNTWYYSDAPKTVRPMLDIIRRQSTFEEVQGGLDESTALFEARRCLSAATASSATTATASARTTR